MSRPEYQRVRMLRAAELVRATKVSSVRELGLSYWITERRYFVEILNLDTGKGARLELTSALDVPTFAEVVETILTRCRV